MHPSLKSPHHEQFRPKATFTNEHCEKLRANGAVVERWLRFDLPFVILVEDGFTVERGQLEHSITNAPFIATTHLGLVHIRFLKMGAPTPAWLLPEGVDLPRAELMGSISKNFTYTHVLVTFPSVDDPEPLDCQEDDFIKKLAYSVAAIEAVSAFLRHYRINNLKYYIPNVTEHSIGIFGMFERFENGAVYNFLFCRQFENPVEFDKSIGAPEEEKLRIQLNTSPRNHIHELFAEVINKLNSQDWRSVVISSAVLFEAWLTPFLKDIYRQKGLSNTTIKEKFKTGPQHYPMGISEICAVRVHEATDYAFHLQTEYTNLLTQVINVRNKLVHGLLLEATSDQAHDSIHAVIEAVGNINFYTKVFKLLHANPGGNFEISETPHPFPDISKVEERLQYTVPSMFIKDPSILLKYKSPA